MMQYKIDIQEFDAVVLANGEFPRNELPLSLLRSGLPVVCCDGAAAKSLDAGIMPTAVVGDGDSLPKALKERLSDRLVVV